ncbi:MAG: TonB-dependent receptor, partial [Myxococcota bacterium]
MTRVLALVLWLWPATAVGQDIIEVEVPYYDPEEEPEDEARETEDEAVEGEASEGEASEGEASEGEATEGEATEGEATEGEATEGEEEAETRAGAGEESSPFQQRELEAGADLQTGIHGHILDSASGQGLEMAPVLIQGRGETRTTLTETGGVYRVYLPPGAYTVRSYYDLFHGARIDRVRVRRARFTEIDLTLDPIEVEEEIVEEIEILYRANTATAAAQDQLRRESSGIGEGVGAEQMSQQGSSDAGSAASRVVGVNVSNSQLVVRGLGGRYTRVLLNGVPVPSTDPDRPGVDLDLFPTSVVESLTVSKAFLPNLPANWAGGLLQIDTVDFPTEFTLEVGLTARANTQTTFRDRLNYDGGGLDFLGFDDGTRALPDEVPDERVTVTRNGGFQTFESVNPVARSFGDTWQFEETTGLPGIGIDITVGDSISLGDDEEDGRFGYLVAAGYSYDATRQIGLSRPRPRVAPDGSLQVFNDYEVERGTDEVQVGGLATASLELGTDHLFTWLGMFNRTMEDQTERQTGTDAELDAGARADRWQLQYVARTLGFTQLLGDHQNLFGSKLRLRWTGFAAFGQRDEPDRRSVTYGSQGAAIRWLEKSNSGERFFSDLDQTDFGGNLNLRFPLWTEGWGSIGGAVSTSGRTLINRRFRFLQDPTNPDQTQYQRPVEEILGDEGIGTLVRLREFSRADDSYESRQSTYSAFAMLETPIAGPLSFSGGARLEVFDQAVESRSPFAREEQDPEELEENRTDRTDLDVLPGVALKVALTETMMIRAAYGMTVARPQIRELAPYQYYDFQRDRNVQGNPDLNRTLIHNADVRWEWFFGEGEIIAVSVFFKEFIDPIELQILNPVNYDAQFINAESARNIGGEIELRVGLGRIAPFLEPFSIGGNVALITSSVT